jgi:hypothetical protein
MMGTDSLKFTKDSPGNNITQFRIYAKWKPVDSLDCADCYCGGPYAYFGTKQVNFEITSLNHQDDTVLTILNLGDLDITISSLITTSNNFTISGDTRRILPLTSADYTIRFSPDSAGSYSGLLIITSNSPTTPDTVRLSGKMVLGVQGKSQRPRFFSLHQNYPNPFNPSTVIEYDLPSREYVSLKVYNILGQEVAVLAEGLQEPGYKSVSFENTKLPSDVYIYRLTSGKFIETKKMLLIK